MCYPDLKRKNALIFSEKNLWTIKKGLTVAKPLGLNK